MKILNAVTISTKFQIVIPLSVRRSLGLKPGQRLQVIEYVDRIELIPILPMRKARGFLKGVETTLDYDIDRE